MSYSPHGKIVLSGDFVAANGTQLEGWSASMSYDVVGPDVGAMPNTIGTAALTSIANAWGAVISSNPGGSGVGFSSRTRLTDVAYWRAKSDGKSTTGQWERYHKASPSVGVGTPGQHALQVATVVSLDAFGPRGGRFGRFYLPAVHEPLEDFRYSTSLVTQLLSSVKQALTTTNTVLSGVVDGDVELVVASGRGNGENRPVRSVKIGRVPDTMRSRRRALEEGYVVTDFQAIP